jgi:FMN phosphatase YigB (HAD superfamily)
MKRTKNIIGDMMYKIKAVVFDLFGTLTNFIDPETEIIRTFNLAIPRTEVKKLVCGQVYKDEDSYFKNIVGGLKIKSVDQLKKILKEEQVKITNLHPESASVLKNLKVKGYKLGLVSNSWPYGAEKFYKLNNYFASMVMSHETGMLKPDTRIF